MEKLTRYMLSSSRLNELLYRKNIVKHEKKQNYIVKDELFWIFYKLKNINYEKYPNFEEENKIKIDLLSNFEKKKDIFKSYKLKKEEIEENLLYSKIISLLGFTSLCLFYNINIIVVIKKCYFTIGIFNCNESSFPTIKVENNNYTMIRSKINDYNDYYKIPHITKPISTISNYKVGDLKEISIKLDISNNATKKELYELIKNNFSCLFNL